MSRISTVVFAYLSALVLLAMIAVATPAYAQAGVCVPLEDVRDQLAVAGVDEDRIVVMEGADFVNDYTRHLGVGIPDGSEPSGAIFIIMDHVVRFGLIETSGCIRYHMPVPRLRHAIAFAASRKGT